MKRLKIGLDIDGVIVDYMQKVLPLLIEVCRRPVTYEEIDRWDLTKALNITEERSAWLWQRVYADSFLLDAPPVPGALAGIEALKAHELWIVTGRPPFIRSITEKWFARYDVKYDELVFARAGSKLKASGEFDVFVDDFLDEAVSFAGAGVLTLLFDRPWNQTEKLPLFCRRVHDWDTIISTVRQLEKNRN